MYEFLEEFEEMLDNAIQNLSGAEFEKLKSRIIERLEEID